MVYGFMVMVSWMEIRVKGRIDLGLNCVIVVLVLVLVVVVVNMKCGPSRGDKAL